ncbi:hypothetical protein AVEN_205538-1 [Araneus ventricosus]|uniref:Uncharacterized protein n=1 Tax=Araneus ventricosus TaxID=182803 RepID=A0A4Y2Q3C1_ARAVE|nr:hypothetical protein AVEN_55151-1 [Araneus ventricosus]GBN58039.1 hypothetical protein AVEN_39951-1 [Araneus ventricosus]GBN87121.1 hypothetical protein AVEN_120290-1 [Araneus ventricosus]GBN87123.1 hypothetical protein AVEN_205538-1 [Araneus ventricosus]
MGQDRTVGRVIQSLPSQGTNVYLSVWGLAISSKNKTPNSRALVGPYSPIRLSPFSCIEVSTIGMSLPKMLIKSGVKAVKNFLQSLGTDFYQDGFFKLISRYDKCINTGGGYVEK